LSGLSAMCPGKNPTRGSHPHPVLSIREPGSRHADQQPGTPDLSFRFDQYEPTIAGQTDLSGVLSGSSLACA
jgi:hypothetical protein